MNLYITQYFRKPTYIFALVLFTLFACDKTPENNKEEPIDYGYTIAVNAPVEHTLYSVGDTMSLNILFSSTTGEYVHYISTDIYNKEKNDVLLYSVHVHQHVPDSFQYTDEFVLKDTTKIKIGEEWVLKATMWSHETDSDTIYLEREIKIIP